MVSFGFIDLLVDILHSLCTCGQTNRLQNQIQNQNYGNLETRIKTNSKNFGVGSFHASPTRYERSSLTRHSLHKLSGEIVPI